MPDNVIRPKRPWPEKFRDAFRGAWEGVRGQSSFRMHFVIAAAVLVAAALIRVSLIEWCLLLLCIAAVFTAEMFNSALERMARAITDEHDPHVGTALDIGSAAVLVASIGSAIVGTTIFLNHLGRWAGWW